jgi:hypothetical protein
MGSNSQIMKGLPDGYALLNGEKYYVKNKNVSMIGLEE